MSATQGSSVRAWLVDLLVGGALGLVAGGIVALNLLIFLGVEGGYEAGIQGAFQHGIFTGLAVVGALAAGPIVGVLMRRRLRRRDLDQSPAANSTL